MVWFSKTPRGRVSKSETGRRPAPTYYRADTAPGTTSPFKKKPPRQKRRRFLLGFLDIALVILLLLALVYSLGLKSQPRVLASDTSFHSLSQYSKAVAGQFSQFKNRNKLTFDETGTVKALQKQFPEISNAQIELPFFSEQATVRLTIAKPSFQLNSSSVNYIISSNGVIIARTADLPRLKNLTIVSDQSGFNAMVGKPVLSANAVGFINTVIAQCRHSKIPLASLVLPTTPQELDLRTTDQSYYVKFYLDGDVLNETGQFLAARQHFIQTHQPPAQYLDVRVSGKVFYK